MTVRCDDHGVQELESLPLDKKRGIPANSNPSPSLVWRSLVCYRKFNHSSCPLSKLRIRVP